MAETKKKKTSPATRTGSKKSAPSSGTASRKRTSVTAAEKKSAPKKGKKNTQKGGEQMAAKVKKKNYFAENYMVYILLAVGLFLTVTYILNAISGDAEPKEHLMGYVGYYLCYGIFGALGWMAYIIPAGLIYLGILWKKYCEERVVVLKILLTAALVLFGSAVIHVFVCAGNDTLITFNPDLIPSLFDTGAVFQSGGVVGGLIGACLYWLLKVPGTIILTVITLPLLVMAFAGVTPGFVFAKISVLVRAAKEKNAEKKARRMAEREEDEEDEEDEAPTETYRARRAREAAEVAAAQAAAEEKAAARRAESARQEKSHPSPKKKAVAADEYEEDYEETAHETPEDRAILLDPQTGEVLENTARPEKKKGLFGGKMVREQAPAEDEEESFGLPMHDPVPAPVAEVTAAERMDAPVPEGAATGRNTNDDETEAYVNKPYRAAPSPRPMEKREEERAMGADTEMESMDVDFDDDADKLPPMPTVAYEVVEENGNVTATAPTAAPTTVRILKAETAALPESGLSEEEVVLSTAHAEEDLPEPTREYMFPPVDMLTKGSSRYEANDAEIAANTQTLREVLESFHIRVKEISCSCGPTITRFEVKPDSGIRVRSIANLVDDIAMGLAKAGVRIEAPIPGKAAVGIEVPNAEPATVYLRNILETPEFRNHKSRIAACLGADVGGRPVILDINKMPHLLVAGTTGSGKSVCINSIIMSILYKAKPDEVKLILIDPKKVEFAVFRDLPHLYCPLISDPNKAAGALNSAVNEMERRFGLIEEVGVRNIAGYNEITAGDPERPPLPQMVIIIDELADLMMTASNEVETAICRLAQKARAAGIHLILGTQRPSTDVITGLIKANIPSRIAFTVTQQIDSRIIIDSVGAEKLIGRGDMLFSPVGCNKPLRVQGTFVSDSEVERVVTFLKEHNEKAEYDESFTRQIDIEAAKCAAGKKKGGDQMSIDDFDGLGGGSGEDPKFWEALEVAVGKDKIGTSALQRAIKIGYGRAAAIIDRMEELGFVGPDPGTKQGRKVYITSQDLMEYKMNGLPGQRGGEGDSSEQ